MRVTKSKLLFLVLLATLLVFVGTGSSFGDTVLTPVIDEPFDTLDGDLWGVTHASSLARSYAPEYGSVQSAEGHLSLRPSEIRGGDVVWSRLPVVTSLPARVTVRLKYPGASFRIPQLYLMPTGVVTEDGRKWIGGSGPRIHITLGATRWPTYPTLYVYGEDGRTGARDPKGYAVPTDSFVDVEMMLQSDRIACSYQGITLETEADVQSLLDVDGGLALSLVQSSDAERGGMDVDHVTIEEIPEVVNEPPIAEAGEDVVVYVRETVKFDGSESHDPDGEIIACDWDFGDGSTADGTEVTHVYDTPGTYAVTLTVTDDVGASSSDSLQVSVLSAEDGLRVLRERADSAVLGNPSGKKAPRGYKAALVKKLDRAIASCASGDTRAARVYLRVFMFQLNRSQVPGDLAREWTAEARRILIALRH
ncbi:MAG: PKD domain-containing protein [Coriobacteriia bacterium]|nr:PKD domain-containing protein [Coriobacteriia bacterium]